MTPQAFWAGKVAATSPTLAKMVRGEGGVRVFITLPGGPIWNLCPTSPQSLVVWGTTVRSGTYRGWGVMSPSVGLMRARRGADLASLRLGLGKWKCTYVSRICQDYRDLIRDV